MFQPISNKLKSKRPWALALSALLSASLLTGCGGSDDSGATPNNESGDVVIGLTDAEGDFISYAVDVTSIKLQKADGTEVETLPITTRIDFAQYVDMTEFVTVATIPAGLYTSASLTMNYADADVQVEVAGDAVATTVIDNSSAPIRSLEMRVKLSERNALLIAPGVPAHLTLDFDLAATHEVDTGVTPPVATAEPLLLADVNLKDPKPHRLRGLLREVYLDRDHFSLALRPLHHRDGRFGRLDAHVDADTVYEINGVSYRGEAGLVAMSELRNTNPWTIVFGLPNRQDRHFLAQEVYVGNSVPGGDQDTVTGIIIARSVDQLTVDASLIVTNDGRVAYRKEVIINLASDTPVNRQLSTADFAKDDISVGQRIVAIGQIDPATSTTPLTMNRPAKVRMLINQFSGDVVSNNGAELIVDMQRFNARPANAFDFSGTGQSAAEDADPTNYQVDTNVLATTAAALEPVKVRGFVTPFGTAPADFEPLTIVNIADVPAAMVMTWSSPSTAAFSQLDRVLVLDLTDSARHHLKRHRIVTDLSTLAAPPTLQANADNDGLGVFAIRKPGSVQIYRDFAEFSTALSHAMDGSVGVSKLYAHGRFDDANTTLTTKGIRIILKPVL